MKEIRLHGIGGQGTVKAGELLVHAAVLDGISGNSLPFFGFERQGAPVTSFVRIDEKKIRPKNQVYNPNCIIVMDTTVMQTQNVFDGIQENSYLIINATESAMKVIDLPPEIKHIAYVDATKIALEELGRPLPNTIMLAAFAKCTGWMSEKNLRSVVLDTFGEKNAESFDRALNETTVKDLGDQ